MWEGGKMEPAPPTPGTPVHFLSPAGSFSEDQRKSRDLTTPLEPSSQLEQDSTGEEMLSELGRAGPGPVALLGQLD